MGQIIGLVLIGMGLQIVGYLAWMARMMINYHLNYRGTARVRYDLFSKLQQLGMTYHRSRPQGDAIFRLIIDVFGPWGIMDVVDRHLGRGGHAHRHDGHHAVAQHNR